VIPALVALILSVQDKPAVDRSAEPALRQLFASTSNLHGAHLLISYYRAGSADYYLPDHTDDVWIGAANQYRVEVNSLSGDSASLLVSDGMSVMSDPLDDDQTIQIDRAGKPMYEVIPRETWAFFLAGPDAFDKFVDKSQPVVFATAAAGEKAIELHSKDLGKIVVSYQDGTANPVPTRIDLFRSFRRRDAGSESTTATTKQYIRVLSTGHLSTSLFSIHVPKGKKVQDDRQKIGS
jgi:hypothetical protein